MKKLLKKNIIRLFVFIEAIFDCWIKQITLMILLNLVVFGQLF